MKKKIKKKRVVGINHYCKLSINFNVKVPDDAKQEWVERLMEAYLPHFVAAVQSYAVKTFSVLDELDGGNGLLNGSGYELK